MSAFSNTFVALTSLAALAQAVPKVTPVLVDGDCAAYPLYGPGTGFVAHFTIEVNQCTDPATSKPCPIEGFGPSFEAKMVDGKEDPSQGYVSNPISIHIQSKDGFLFPCFFSFFANVNSLHFFRSPSLVLKTKRKSEWIAILTPALESRPMIRK